MDVITATAIPMPFPPPVPPPNYQSSSPALQWLLTTSTIKSTLLPSFKALLVQLPPVFIASLAPFPQENQTFQVLYNRGKKISVLFHASLGALCQARRLWEHHRRSIRGLSAICPHGNVVTAFHLRGKTMQPVGESQPLASWRISAWMGSFNRGFFVML